GDALDEVIEEEVVERGDHGGRDQGGGEELPPVEDVAADQLGRDADREHLLGGGRDHHQRVDEILHREREGEDGGGQDAGDADRRHSVQHGWPAVAPGGRG